MAGAARVDSGRRPKPQGGTLNILGLIYYFHDSTACLLVDGKITDAIEEERLTRKKHTTALPEMRDHPPAVTHVDGSARLYTVDKRINPLYHDVIRGFGELTGTPVVLNTSFNVMREPIVESPEQAVRCYASTGQDALAVGNYLITKN